MRFPWLLAALAVSNISRLPLYTIYGDLFRLPLTSHVADLEVAQGHVITNSIHAVSFARVLLVVDHGSGYRQRFRFRLLGIIRWLRPACSAFPRIRLQHRLDLDLFVGDFAFISDLAFDLLVHAMLVLRQLLQAVQQIRTLRVIRQIIAVESRW